MTCADVCGERNAKDCAEWHLGGPKQPPFTLLAAQQAGRARTDVSQSVVRGWHWQVMNFHLAGWCARMRRPEHLRSGGSVLWVP